MPGCDAVRDRDADGDRGGGPAGRGVEDRGGGRDEVARDPVAVVGDQVGGVDPSRRAGGSVEHVEPGLGGRGGASGGGPEPQRSLGRAAGPGTALHRLLGEVGRPVDERPRPRGVELHEALGVGTEAPGHHGEVGGGGAGCGAVRRRGGSDDGGFLVGGDRHLDAGGARAPELEHPLHDGGGRLEARSRDLVVDRARLRHGLAPAGRNPLVRAWRGRPSTALAAWRPPSVAPSMQPAFKPVSVQSPASARFS